MTLHQRPSDNLETLGSQLSSALETLTNEATGPEARDFRRFLRHVLAHAWRGAATGDFNAARDAIDVLCDARPMINDALPGLSARALAAVEVQQALAALYVGEDELREVELENRLTDRGRHPTERAVLEVLAKAERPLRQAEVHERLELPKKGLPTPSRVGQILRDLYGHGFARRQLARARGYAEVSHYLLAPRGLRLCEQLGISTPKSGEKQDRRALTATPGVLPQVKAREVLETVLDPSVDPKIRRVAAGAIANSGRDGFKELFPELLSPELSQQTDELGRSLLWAIRVTHTLGSTKDLLEKMMNGCKQPARREEIQEAIEDIDCTSALLLAA